MAAPLKQANTSRVTRLKRAVSLVESWIKVGTNGTVLANQDGALFHLLGRRLERPLRKDDTQIREAFHIF
ncbi:hypothetical protein DPMN_127902 [Dreissena polymorpha]|uniref:Uncharacterized protein n=1 Tax=Dreissena polymorpha TaxID=45954 RepID=A0A9D4GZU6_DREPO|nr:hypothetical protein DPMN_127902 [Dreissena polymorpha]